MDSTGMPVQQGEQCKENIIITLTLTATALWKLVPHAISNRRRHLWIVSMCVFRPPSVTV